MSEVVCSGCSEPIRDVVLNAFGMTWHNTCLCCNVCGKDFSDGSRCEEGQDGFAYCSKDFLETFAPKRGGCSQPIVGQMLEALGKKWHPDHFICNTCKKILSGQFSATEDGIR